MIVGVTGGAGFIGGYVCEELQRRGHEPVVFDHLGRGDGSVMLGDVRDATAMTELAAHVDGIIHLAACLGTQETIRNPRPAAETNIQGGLNFLEAIAQYGIPGCYIGVGNHWMDNTYSISKTAVERFVRMFNRERRTRCNVVRLVNAYGPRQSVAPPFGPAKVRKITPAFVCRALTGQPIEVYGDGQQVSDMVWVGDGARALVAALEGADRGAVHDRVVECGPAQHTTVERVAELVRRHVARLGYEPQGVVHLPMRPGEVPGAKVIADYETLRLVGIDPETLKPLDEGIAETVRWYAEHWLPGYLKGQGR
jgi:nucleoside-diphosphate-sugar epimerase